MQHGQHGESAGEAAVTGTRQPLYSTAQDVPVFERGGEAAAAAFFREHGLVLLRLLTPTECDDMIAATWTGLLDEQPLLPAFSLKGTHPHPVTERAAFLEFAKRAKIPPRERTRLREGWTNHSQFGACADAESFNSEALWRVRTKEEFAALGRLITGEEDVRVEINRTITKLPGAGDLEFLHWDFNPCAARAELCTATPPVSNVGGKLSFNGTTFIGGPGTHQPRFFEAFFEHYGPLYERQFGDAAGKLCKFGLDIHKPDPMNLFGDRRANRPSAWVKRIVVPPGCAILWRTEILHGTEKNPVHGAIEYGMYLGLAPSESPARKRKYEDVAGISELLDRLLSVLRGQRPRLYPSGDRTHYAPYRGLNFEKIFAGRIAKMPPGHPFVGERTTKGGERRLMLDDGFRPAPGYVAPQFATPAALRVLVGDRFVCSQTGALLVDALRDALVRAPTGDYPDGTVDDVLERLQRAYTFRG